MVAGMMLLHFCREVVEEKKYRRAMQAKIQATLSERMSLSTTCHTVSQAGYLPSWRL
jgi:hypothetical protein